MNKKDIKLTKIKAVADYVFLEYLSEKDQSKSAIVVSDIMKSKQPTARVVACGPDVQTIKIRDEVIFDPFVPREVEIKGRKYYILREKYIYGII